MYDVHYQPQQSIKYLLLPGVNLRAGPSIYLFYCILHHLCLHLKSYTNMVNNLIK